MQWFKKKPEIVIEQEKQPDVSSELVKQQEIKNLVKQEIKSELRLELLTILKKDFFQFQQKQEELEEKQEQLDKKTNKILSLQNQLKDAVIELSQAITAPTRNYDLDIDQLKQNILADQEIAKNNFIHVRKKQKELFDKFDSLLEVFVEKLSNDEETIPDLFRTDMTLKKIMSSMKNKNKALLTSIVFLLKKQSDEKGSRV